MDFWVQVANCNARHAAAAHRVHGTHQTHANPVHQRNLRQLPVHVW